MHVEYEVSKQNYVSAASLAARKGSISSRLRYYYFYAFATLWLIISLGSLRSGGHWDPAGIALDLTILPVLAIVLWIERLKFAWQFRKSANLHGIQQFDADESGTKLKTSESDTRSTWRAYSKLAENSRVFVLFHPGDKTFIAIPKCALNSEQVDEFRSLFKANLAR
jgi:hypothetical protein